MTNTINGAATGFAAYNVNGSESPAIPASRPNQILPVADLPADFDGVPLDGSQYLAVVRQQAQRAPTFARAVNPYAVQPGRDAAIITSIPGELPSAEWRSSFLTRLRNMREALSNRPRADGGADVGVPKTKDAKRWLAFVHDEEKPSHNDESKGREPSSALLARLQTQQILYLLQVLGDAITDDAEEESSAKNKGAPLDPLYAKWLFALLAHLDERLVADDVSTLRTLARACVGTIAQQRRASTLSNTAHVDIQAELGAWIVVCAVAGIWSQHDLWDDASAALATPVEAP